MSDNVFPDDGHADNDPTKRLRAYARSLLLDFVLKAEEENGEDVASLDAFALFDFMQGLISPEEWDENERIVLQNYYTDAGGWWWRNPETENGLHQFLPADIWEDIVRWRREEEQSKQEHTQLPPLWQSTEPHKSYLGYKLMLNEQQIPSNPKSVFEPKVITEGCVVVLRKNGNGDVECALKEDSPEGEIEQAIGRVLATQETEDLRTVALVGFKEKELINLNTLVSELQNKVCSSLRVDSKFLSPPSDESEFDHI